MERDGRRVSVSAGLWPEPGEQGWGWEPGEAAVSRAAGSKGSERRTVWLEAAAQHNLLAPFS